MVNTFTALRDFTNHLWTHFNYIFCIVGWRWNFYISDQTNSFQLIIIKIGQTSPFASTLLMRWLDVDGSTFFSLTPSTHGRCWWRFSSRITLTKMANGYYTWNSSKKIPLFQHREESLLSLHLLNLLISKFKKFCFFTFEGFRFSNSPSKAIILNEDLLTGTADIKVLQIQKHACR